jgi:hypothetical protein
MNKPAKDTLEKIRSAFHALVKNLSNEDFIEVCEEFSCDLDGHIESAKQEISEEKDD